jgi:WD40 repeat protein
VAGDALRLQVTFHPGADVLASGGDTVKVWAYEPSRFVPMAPNKAGKPSLPGKELGAIKLGDFSLGISFSPDGSLLAVGKSNGGVEVWKLA